MMSLKKRLLAYLIIEEEDDDATAEQILRSFRKGVHQMFKARNEEGCFLQLITNHLRQDIEKFREYFRLAPSQFYFILSLIEEDIKNTAYNRNLYPISPEEKLAVTLRKVKNNYIKCFFKCFIMSKRRV